jgi:hypothetical protein
MNIYCRTKKLKSILDIRSKNKCVLTIRDIRIGMFGIHFVSLSSLYDSEDPESFIFGTVHLPPEEFYD